MKNSVYKTAVEITLDWDHPFQFAHNIYEAVCSLNELYFTALFWVPL